MLPLERESSTEQQWHPELRRQLLASVSGLFRVREEAVRPWQSSQSPASILEACLLEGSQEGRASRAIIRLRGVQHGRFYKLAGVQ